MYGLPVLDAIFRQQALQDEASSSAAESTSEPAAASSAATTLRIKTVTREPRPSLAVTTTYSCEDLETGVTTAASNPGGSEYCPTPKSHASGAMKPLKPAAAAVDDRRTSVFVGGVPYDLQEPVLCAIFSQWGTVLSIKLIKAGRGD